MMTLEQLPPKGVKREQAILELGKEEANGELLFQLVNTEKGQMQNGCSKGFGAAGVCLCCPAVGQTGQGQMDGQQYHVGCLFRLCIGADCPSYSIGKTAQTRTPGSSAGTELCCPVSAWGMAFKTVW